MRSDDSHKADGAAKRRYGRRHKAAGQKRLDADEAHISPGDLCELVPEQYDIQAFKVACRQDDAHRHGDCQYDDAVPAGCRKTAGYPAVVQFKAFLRGKILREHGEGAADEAQQHAEDEQHGGAAEADRNGDDAGAGQGCARKGGSGNREIAGSCEGQGPRSCQGSAQPGAGRYAKYMRVCQRVTEDSLHLAAGQGQATAGKDGADEPGNANLGQYGMRHRVLRIQQFPYAQGHSAKQEFQRSQQKSQQHESRQGEPVFSCLFHLLQYDLTKIRKFIYLCVLITVLWHLKTTP